MQFLKLGIAIALFVTSATFQEQIINTNTGTEVSWSVTVTSTKAVASQRLQEMADTHYLY